MGEMATQVLSPQQNSPAGDWIEFWRVQRLQYQLDLAAHKGAGGRLEARVCNIQLGAR